MHPSHLKAETDWPDAICRRDANFQCLDFNLFLFFSNLRNDFSNLSHLVHIDFSAF